MGFLAHKVRWNGVNTWFLKEPLHFASMNAGEEDHTFFGPLHHPKKKYMRLNEQLHKKASGIYLV